MLLAAVLLGGAGCQTIDERLAETTAGPPPERRDQLVELSDWLRHLRPGDPEANQARARLSAFLDHRFDEDIEPDAVARSQLLSLALQGELPARADMLARGCRDSHWLVRLRAAQGMREVQPPDTRALLEELVRLDSELQVRIEAVKTMGHIGTPEWVPPLARIVVDPAEEPDLRHQAYLAADRLLPDERLPYLPSAWREWLDAHP